MVNVTVKLTVSERRAVTLLKSLLTRKCFRNVQVTIGGSQDAE
jgi:hypothetical protein